MAAPVITVARVGVATTTSDKVSYVCGCRLALLKRALLSTSRDDAATHM
jgi:hypothetical protein